MLLPFDQYVNFGLNEHTTSLTTSRKSSTYFSSTQKEKERKDDKRCKKVIPSTYYFGISHVRNLPMDPSVGSVILPESSLDGKNP